MALVSLRAAAVRAVGMLTDCSFPTATRQLNVLISSDSMSSKSILPGSQVFRYPVQRITENVLGSTKMEILLRSNILTRHGIEHAHRMLPVCQ